jgi:5-methylcytosine-specific restriction endonuclease McrBC regulatory subunit McrC
MTDQELTLQAVSDAHRIIEEYLEPRPHNNERLLDRLVEVLEKPGLLVAVDRLQRDNDR